MDTPVDKASDQLENDAERKPVEVQLPIIMVRTTYGLRVLERLGHLRSSKWLGWIFLAVFPVSAGAGFYLIINTILAYLSSPAIQQAVRSAGPLVNLLIPGLNPYLPLVYGWIAVVLAIVVHEGGHGVIARSLGFPVKYAGILLFLIIPVGAFVEVDEKLLKKAKVGDATRVLAAGTASNMITALLALLVIIVVVSSLTPVTPFHGVGVVGVAENYPAHRAGMTPGNLILSVNDQPTLRVSDFSAIMSEMEPYELVTVTVAHGGGAEKMAVQLASNPQNTSAALLGVQLIDDPTEHLDAYKRLSSLSPLVYLITPTIFSGPYIVPYSDVMHIFYTSPVGDVYYPLANLFYWVWFVNFNLAVFNALPIYPLDGGIALSRLVCRVGGSRFNEKTAMRITYAVTAAVLFLVVSMVVLPYLGKQV